MKTLTYVTSRMAYVPQDIMSTASATFTGQKSTMLLRATTLVDTTPMADAIITQANVLTDIIQLTVNAIVSPAGIPPQRVYILMDIIVSRPYQGLVEPATITVSTVLGSLLMSATVT